MGYEKSITKKFNLERIIKMENFRKYIGTTLNAMENSFEKLEKLFDDLRTNGINKWFESEDEADAYRYIIDLFDKIDPEICKVSHLAADARAVTLAMNNKLIENDYLWLFVNSNLYVELKKQEYYVDLYNKFKAFNDEAKDFFNSHSPLNN